MATERPEERERIVREETRLEPGTTTGVRRVYEQREPELERRGGTATVVAGGSLAEGLGGAAAVVLAIIGLAGALPRFMAAIATIAIGVAFLAQGGAIASRWHDIAARAHGIEDTKAEVGAGMSAELLGGAAGVALGILALIGLVPNLLLPVALLVFGATLLLSSASQYDLGRMEAFGEQRSGRVREIVAGASGTSLLVGIATIVLGIIALVDTRNAINVTLVGLLVVGGGILLTGAALGRRMFARVHH